MKILVEKAFSMMESDLKEACEIREQFHEKNHSSFHYLVGQSHASIYLSTE